MKDRKEHWKAAKKYGIYPESKWTEPSEDKKDDIARVMQYCVDNHNGNLAEMFAAIRTQGELLDEAVKAINEVKSYTDGCGCCSSEDVSENEKIKTFLAKLRKDGE